MEPLILIMNLDNCELRCPCGKSTIPDSEEEYSGFIKDHKDHTNGYIKEITSDNGAKAYAQKPDPETYPIKQ